MTKDDKEIGQTVEVNAVIDRIEDGAIAVLSLDDEKRSQIDLPIAQLPVGASDGEHLRQWMTNRFREELVEVGGRDVVAGEHRCRRAVPGDRIDIGPCHIHFGAEREPGSSARVADTKAPGTVHAIPLSDLVSSGIDNVQHAQSTADNLAQQAATGDLTDLHDYMIASTQAQLATDLTVTVRNKAVDAFNEIMRMQI